MTGGINILDRGHTRGIYFLFDADQRPNSFAVHRFVKQVPGLSISFDPSSSIQRQTLNSIESHEDDQGVVDTDSVGWLELHSSGLTFDLIGLGDGPTVTLPQTDHEFDCDGNFDRSSLSTVNLVPSEHLIAGEATMPILQGLLRLARDFVQHFEQTKYLIWPHSKSIIGRRFFESTVTAFLDGGAFPALGLTAFHEVADGGLETVGLAHFIGQELRLDANIVNDRVAATRLGVRLVNQLVLTGAVNGPEQLTGMDGQIIRLEPSENGRLIRVSNG